MVLGWENHAVANSHRLTRSEQATTIDDMDLPIKPIPLGAVVTTAVGRNDTEIAQRHIAQGEGFISIVAITAATADKYRQAVEDWQAQVEKAGQVILVDHVRPRPGEEAGVVHDVAVWTPLERGPFMPHIRNGMPQPLELPISVDGYLDGETLTVEVAARQVPLAELHSHQAVHELLGLLHPPFELHCPHGVTLEELLDHAEAAEDFEDRQMLEVIANTVRQVGDRDPYATVAANLLDAGTPVRQVRRAIADLR